MLSKFGTVKVLVQSALVIATTMSPGLASSPLGYTQTPSTESTAMLNPVSPKGLPAQRACRLIAKVVSAPMPLPGQKSRSSGNFNLNSIRVGETFRVIVMKGGRTTNNRIRFNLKRDVRGAVDPIARPNMRTGLYRRVSNSSLYPVYIADPSGAGTSRFTVKFCRN
ncbi:MAG: hypothetical protein N4J56_006498 [Chroococcidiopsis sp. SAG 2025]|nr:hypothetical protein [Chroococcidiopsis sp. SAG 2025]